MKLYFGSTNNEGFPPLNQMKEILTVYVICFDHLDLCLSKMFPIKHNTCLSKLDPLNTSRQQSLSLIYHYLAYIFSLLLHLFWLKARIQILYINTKGLIQWTLMLSIYHRNKNPCMKTYNIKKRLKTWWALLGFCMC